MKLIKIELRKLLHNRVMWMTIGGYIIAMILILIGVRYAIISANRSTSETANIQFLPSEIFKFPLVWHNLTFIGRFIKVLLAVIMVTIVTNEFTYDTLKQSVINGLSRFELVLSKFYVALLLSVFASLIIMVFGFVSGFLNTENISWWKITSDIVYIPTYFLMLLTFLSLATFLSFLIKRPGVVLLILLFYIFALEPFLSLFLLKDSVGPYLPMHMLNELITSPPNAISKMFGRGGADDGILLVNVVGSIVYVFVFNLISYFTLRSRDL